MARRGHSFTDAARGERLQRVLADAGVGSRRHCEALIEAGAVTVNGEVVDSLPAWVDPRSDRIVVDGRPMKRDRDRPIYIMLNKPRGVVSTNSDPEGRPRAIDLVQHPDRPRLYPVGRLDMDSSGLLLLTNDGELANRLTHPSFEVHKGYEVVVGGLLQPEDAKHLELGIFLPERPARSRERAERGGRGARGERAGSGPAARAAPRGRRTQRSSLRILARDRDRTILYMELREGRNRQIRRMMQRLGHPVKKLKRVCMGPLQLKGLGIGEWRELTARELAALRRATDGAARQAT
ncbi:MAG: pseudouridine synthase [Phycisphaerales bacterium]